MRGRSGFAVLLAALAGLLGAAAAGAALINPVSQTRTIFAEANGYDGSNWIRDSQTDGAPDFGLFDSAVTAQVDIPGGTVIASATQLSAIGSASVSARGSAVAHFGPDFSFSVTTAHSDFELTFDVLQPLTFVLTGYVVVSSPFLLPTQGEAGVTLRGGPGNQMIVQFGIADFGHQFGYGEGELLPGQYTLTANSRIFNDWIVDGYGSDPLSASYEFDLSVVPEPATGLLLAGGLLALAIRRRRRSA
jgi:hypothetical protein